MKRILPLIFCLLFSVMPALTACTSDAKPEPPATKTSAAEASGSSVPVNMDAGEVSQLRIRDASTGLENTFSEKNFINEFFSNLKNNKLSPIKKPAAEAFTVGLLDNTGSIFLKAAFNENTVYFNQDIKLGNTVLEKGAYESSDLYWTNLSFYIGEMSGGTVVDPEFVQYPATIRIPGFSEDYNRLELIDRGNGRVTDYNIYPMLYNLFNTCVKSKDLEIAGCKRYYSYETVQAEAKRLKKECRCILASFQCSDSRLELKSKNPYKEAVLAESLILAKEPDKPGMFKLVTDKMIFEIKAANDMAKKFDLLFAENSKADKYVTPKEIKMLFDSKKPYYMEFVCKNLGIEDWQGLAPNELKIEEMKLNTDSKPYTVVNLKSGFTQRLLVFRQKPGKNYNFLGNMEFRGWPDEPGYRKITAGNKIWFTGKKYMGHGTGEYKSNQQWYRVSDIGVESVLQFPFNEYSDGPYGGYSIMAKKVELKDGNNIKVVVDYDTSRKYNLFTGNADEYGAVELKGNKTAVFVWDEKMGKFVSEYETDDYGAFVIPTDTPEIARARDSLLEKHFTEIEKVIKGIPLQENEYERYRRTEGIRSFLNDCSDGKGKSELLKTLAAAVGE